MDSLEWNKVPVESYDYIVYHIIVNKNSAHNERRKKMIAVFHGVEVEIDGFDTRTKECLVKDKVNHTFAVWVSVDDVKIVKEA